MNYFQKFRKLKRQFEIHKQKTEEEKQQTAEHIKRLENDTDVVSLEKELELLRSENQRLSFELDNLGDYMRTLGREFEKNIDFTNAQRTYISKLEQEIRELKAASEPKNKSFLQRVFGS